MMNDVDEKYRLFGSSNQKRPVFIDDAIIERVSEDPPSPKANG